ncbi:MAG: hypothetical protein AAGG56_03745 [Pseudomonadota bacterium]
MSAFLAEMRMEWRLQRARPFVWFCLAASFALAFGATVENGLGARGFSWVNGADAIATRALILSVLSIIAAAGIIGDAMGRDRASATEETVLSTGVQPTTVAMARFLVAFSITLAVGVMFVPGMMLGTLFPGIPEERIGPHELSHYLCAFGVYVFPNLLLVSALIFAVSSRFQSQTAGFVVSLGLIALYVSALMSLGQTAYRHEVFALAALLDPYGNIAGAEFAMGWTVAENNVRFRPLDGLLFWNRAIWMTVALGLIAAGTLWRPKYLQQPRQSKKRTKSRGGLRAPISIDNALLRMTIWELKTLWRQPGVLLLLGFAAISLWWAASSAVTFSFSLPTTDLLVHNSGFYFDKVLVLLLVWYAGDIIWRERQHHVHELIEATPAADFTRLLSKTLALVLMAIAFWALSIAVNVSYQIANGFYDFEFWLYLTDTFLVKAPYYVWIAILAISAQVILRQRYIAVAAVLFVYLSSTLFDALGLYHPLMRFGEVSFAWYSMMDGYGHFWEAHLWFLAYWTLGAALIWTVAWSTYGRGTIVPLRRSLMKQRLARGPGKWSFAAVSVGFLATGGVIFVNSTIMHRWPLFDEAAYLAWIEKTYREDWSDVAQPKVVAISGEIDFFPDARRVEMDGVLVVENRDDDPINDLLVFFHPLMSTAEVALNEIAREDTDKTSSHVQVWRLNQPLEPGGRMELPFRTVSAPDPGFAAHSQHDHIPEVQSVEVIGNGTSLLNLNLMPALGYSERLEHRPAWLRKLYGLPPDWHPPESSLGVDVAHDTTHLGWVEQVNVTVSTIEDQIPLHSGEIVEDYGIVDGRRSIRYRLHSPSRGWAEVMSGRYEVFRAAREGLPPVELFFHPEHDYVLEPMSEKLLDALDYFQERYGTAPFETFRMAEASLHYEGLGARGGLAFVNEVLGWKSDLERSGGEDLRGYAGNFMAQCWWLDQIMPANLPGAKSVLTGLPYWTAALYLHAARGPETSRKMRLQDMLESFRHRAQLDDAERPFIEEMKDSTMIRLKGSLHIIHLAELAGQERLEAALGGFLETWRYRPAPYPTAEDLFSHLERELPAEALPALEDFFRHVTTWDVGVTEAEVWPRPDGGWQLEAKIEAAKHVTTGLGEQTEAPLTSPIPITVFRGDGFDEDAIVTQEWQMLPSGASTISMRLDEKPTRIGLDAYLTLPDANPYDNVSVVREIDAP